jgi:hypothetical protein
MTGFSNGSGSGRANGSGNGSLNGSRFFQYKPTEVHNYEKKTDSVGSFLTGVAVTATALGVAGVIANEVEKREKAKKSFFQKLLD